MSEHRLSVWAPQGRVGFLVHDTGTGLFRFEYENAWVRHPKRFAISLHIPFVPGEGVTAQAHSNTVRRFIDNLLPEGQALEDVVHTYQVSRSNTFGLIAAIGQETTGALRFLPADAEPPESRDLRRLLPREELSERIRARPYQPFSVWDGRVRLSAAGVQDKIAVYLDPGTQDLYLVEGRYSSTHILKPEPIVTHGPDLHMVANEHFCMSLARAVGLPVAEVEIWRVPEPLLVVKRFDRHVQADSVMRLHLIDGCQALDFPVSHKYERNLGENNPVVQQIREGVSYPRLFGLSPSLLQPALYRQQLVHWLLFQALIENGDAHGKNLSYFVEPAGLRLAPAYDLLCTTPYPRLSNVMSMAIGDEFHFASLKAFDWACLAAACGLERKYLARTMKRLAGNVLAEAARVAEEGPYTAEERSFLDTVLTNVTAAAERMTSVADEVSRIPSELL